MARARLKLELKSKVALAVSRVREKPKLGPNPEGGPDPSPFTAIILCPLGFDALVPTAASTLRLGLARGFRQIGVRYRLVTPSRLGATLGECENPFVYLSSYDYPSLSKRTRKALRNVSHLVWVNPWFAGMESLYEKHGLYLEGSGPSSMAVQAVLESEASFLFTISTPSKLDLFHEWIRRGQRVESLPLACDADRYFKLPPSTRFLGTEVAFVGGFREYKNLQYEKYLKPYEDRLTVFGAGNPWPYSGYSGLLADDDERLLYQNARVCPSLSEPHAEFTGDIVERVFKVAGSGGLAVTDVVDSYADLFSATEMLVPANLAEYHEMVRTALADEDFNRTYRSAGYKAVMERHTYAHRAARILGLLGLKVPCPPRDVIDP